MRRPPDVPRTHKAADNLRTDTSRDMCAAAQGHLSCRDRRDKTAKWSYVLRLWGQYYYRPRSPRPASLGRFLGYYVVNPGAKIRWLAGGLAIAR